MKHLALIAAILVAPAFAQEAKSPESVRTAKQADAAVAAVHTADEELQTHWKKYLQASDAEARKYHLEHCFGHVVQQRLTLVELEKWLKSQISE